MCTGRVDLAFILRALRRGADGVIIGGCWPGECHYVTEGNYDALANVLLCRKLFEKIGLRPERVRLEWIATSEGARFAAVMSDFCRQMKELGPIGRTEGLEAAVLDARLEALARLVPFLKLVEREKLRPPVRSEEGYRTYYARDDVNRLLDTLVMDKLVTAQILLLLEEGPRTSPEIADRMGLSSSEIAQYLKEASKQGLVTYDTTDGTYRPAGAVFPASPAAGT